MKKGFTLIELLVVVAIIGILAAVGVVAYNGYTGAAKINAVKTNFDGELVGVYELHTFSSFDEKFQIHYRGSLDLCDYPIIFIDKLNPKFTNIDFDEESLNDLTNSIRERGVIQPIIVRKSDDKYEIIAGERRWLAARKAGLHEIPVVVTVADDLKSLEFAIVENVQRHDLNPLEEALGYKRLIDEFSYDQEKVSKFIGKSRSYITNTLRLLNLPSDVLKFVEEKKNNSWTC